MDPDFKLGLWTQTLDPDLGPGLWTRTLDLDFGPRLWTRALDPDFGPGRTHTGQDGPVQVWIINCTNKRHSGDVLLCIINSDTFKSTTNSDTFAFQISRA